MHHYAWLLIALPLIGAFAIAVHVLQGRALGDAGERPTARLALGSSGLVLLGLLALDLQAALNGVPGHATLGTWFASGAVQVPLSLHLDTLALAMATLAALLVWITQRFAVTYLHREPGFHRFFIAMGLFGAGMQCIFLAGNAVLSFVGWELAGVSSWLLIGYAYDRRTATANAQRAFVTNRIGDAGFVLGIALAFGGLGTVEWPGVNAATGLSGLAAGLIAVGFVVAALAKSAQVPFAPWIARALEGPTPSSAIFYGAVMVHVGVYLLLRVEPLLVQVPALMAVIALLGLLTALYGALSGLTQTDVKSTLMFATTTQVGLMFLEIGLGLFELAAWHMALHALWRAWQFLASPSYMHMVTGAAKPVPAWMARCQRLYTAALQRFWLEPLGDWLLVRPTQSLAGDVRDFDDRVVSRLVGMPEETQVKAVQRAGDAEVIQGWGLVGGFMLWLAERLRHFEERLVLQPGGGALASLLAGLGEALRGIEALLERPRYLLLLIMATLVVIL